MEHKHVEGREKQEARRVTLDKVGRSKEMLCNTNVSLKLEQMLNENLLPLAYLFFAEWWFQR